MVSAVMLQLRAAALTSRATVALVDGQALARSWAWLAFRASPVGLLPVRLSLHCSYSCD